MLNSSYKHPNWSRHLLLLGSAAALSVAVLALVWASAQPFGLEMLGGSAPSVPYRDADSLTGLHAGSYGSGELRSISAESGEKDKAPLEAMRDGLHEEHEESALPARLRAKVESSLTGALDAAAILELGLELASYEVNPAAVPLADPGGWVRFPLLGVSEGMTAELHVAQAQVAGRSPTVLSLFVECAPREGKSFIEGSKRSSLRARLTVWRDRQGDLEHFAIFTSARPVGWTKGEIPGGVHYAMDLRNPSKNALSMHGRRDGAPAEPAPAFLIGAPVAEADIEAFGEGLRHMHGRLLQQSGR